VIETRLAAVSQIVLAFNCAEFDLHQGHGRDSWHHIKNERRIAGRTVNELSRARDQPAGRAAFADWHPEIQPDAGRSRVLMCNHETASALAGHRRSCPRPKARLAPGAE
jgi:hypothetical protein